MTQTTTATLSALLPLLLGSCATTSDRQDGAHPGIHWVRTAAEFEAIGLQVYGAATRALSGKVRDTSWSALPEQHAAEHLPPAIVFDVDETVVTNVDFQLTLEPPFRDEKLYDWSAANEAMPVPGVVEFAAAARGMGVELFFVTNRPCLPELSDTDPCPFKTVTAEDIAEAGIPVTPDRVMLSYERPGWNKEKKNRRDVIARDYRVIMLIGDDLGDFIPCSRRRAIAPCGEDATRTSRARATHAHREYWGDGWYILPNPMHGSWTSVRDIE